MNKVSFFWYDLLLFRNRTLFFILFISLLISSCSSVSKLKNQNYAKIYKRNPSSINPEYLVYHESDSLSRVYFSIKSKELLYSKKENEQSFIARVMIHYNLYESYESNTVIDSATSYITDICREAECSSVARHEILGDFELKLPLGKKYILEIITTDIYRNQFNIRHISADKSGRGVRQNFLLKTMDSSNPLFRNYLEPGEKIKIKYGNEAGKQIICRYYNHSFPIAQPPFSVFEPGPFDYRADSIFALYTDSIGYFDFEMQKTGFYHFLADTAGKSGLTVYCFNDKFPAIGTADDMMLPLRYITSKKEYTDLSSSENRKEAMDKFWLEVGISPDRSKELIRQFYNRVQDANRYFSSCMEGWKTDRGMIYIVFGPPNIIYKTSETESWLYGEENNFMSISFNFYKVPNPFTDNDFLMERSPIYKANYYKAVDTWREGRVFTTN